MHAWHGMGMACQTGRNHGASTSMSPFFFPSLSHPAFSLGVCASVFCRGGFGAVGFVNGSGSTYRVLHSEGRGILMAVRGVGSCGTLKESDGIIVIAMDAFLLNSE